MQAKVVSRTRTLHFDYTQYRQLCKCLWSAEDELRSEPALNAGEGVLPELFCMHTQTADSSPGSSALYCSWRLYAESFFCSIV